MIKIHKAEHFKKMRKAGILARDALNYVCEQVSPGISTLELNNLCHDFIINKGGIPAPLNYEGFPKSICTSLNFVVCHGIPSHLDILNDGDIISIDVSVILDDWYGDTCKTVPVGNISSPAQNLIDTTKKSLDLIIEKLRPGLTLGDIGHTIQQYVENKGYSVVRNFGGHGIGQKFHAEPHVLHYGKPNTGPTLKEGMFFTIEPMINIGKKDIKILDDGWTVITVDKTLSAQFEHTLGLTSNGVDIFTI